MTHEPGGVLLWCDLDHFKDINDSLGHSTGDLFLKRVADAFRIEVRRGEILARLGGDEFGVLLPDASMEDAAALARRLLESVRRETAAIKSRGLRTTASIGLVAFPEHGSTAEDLLTRADIAMYQAKREGRGRIEVFSTTTICGRSSPGSRSPIRCGRAWSRTAWSSTSSRSATCATARWRATKRCCGCPTSTAS